MALSVRPAVYALPSYSLTSDLLAFLRCGLQYRFMKLGRLPSARPVQLWFGQFIHGVLEESYRRYDVAFKAGKRDLPPWPEARIEEIRELIKRRLAAEGIYPWDEELEALGDRRAEVAINELGPILFPLIHRAEVKLTGARPIPPAKEKFREADRYEMVGIVDVITHLQLNNPVVRSNQLVQLVLEQLPDKPPPRFEMIIDYKGMRRPPCKVSSGSGPDYWDIYGWQIQTYAHLRSKQHDALPVIAGAIVYLNELVPTPTDVRDLRREMQDATTDVVSVGSSVEGKLINKWKAGDPVPNLPLEFRLRRAVRVVHVTQETSEKSLRSFDTIVSQIESCRAKELRSGKVMATWDQNVSDESTCAACDSRSFCPSYTKQNLPRLPGLQRKSS